MAQMVEIELLGKDATSDVQKLALVSDRKLYIKRNGVDQILDFSNAVEDCVYRYPTNTLINGFSAHYSLLDHSLITSFGIHSTPPNATRRYTIENSDTVEYPVFLFRGRGQQAVVPVASTTVTIIQPETREEFLLDAQPRLTRMAILFAKEFSAIWGHLVGWQDASTRGHRANSTQSRFGEFKQENTENYFRSIIGYISYMAEQTSTTTDDVKKIRKYLEITENQIFGTRLEELIRRNLEKVSPGHDFVMDFFRLHNQTDWREKSGKPALNIANSDFTIGEEVYDTADMFTTDRSPAAMRTAYTLNLMTAQFAKVWFNNNINLYQRERIIT